MDGTEPQVLARGAYSFAPGADSAHVLYIASAGFSIESVPVNGGPPKVLWRAPEGSRIVDFVALAGERIIAVVTSDAGTALFGLRGNREQGITEPPRRLTEWRPEGMFSLSGSADGTRLVVMRDQSQQDIYVADFDAQAGTLTEPRRFTSDERDDCCARVGSGQLRGVLCLESKRGFRHFSPASCWRIPGARDCESWRPGQTGGHRRWSVVTLF